MIHRKGAVLLAAFSCAAIVPASAAQDEEGEGEFRTGLSLGATHSDNAGRSQGNEEPETSLNVGLSSSLNYERNRRSFYLNADLRYESHSYGTYSDSLLGGIEGRAAYSLLHDRLTWVAEDNLGQALIQPHDVATPDNTQNVNVFSTGPDILLPLGQRTSISLQGRGTDVSYEEGDFGNRRLSGTLGVVRRMGARSSLSLQGSTEHIMYKSLPHESDYDVHSANLVWSAVGSKTTLNVQGGYSLLEEHEASAGSATFGLELTRRLSARGELSLFAGRNFGDAADRLKLDQGIRGTGVGNRPATISSDPFKSDHATVAWEFGGLRSQVAVSANWRREAHTTVKTLDRHAFDGGLHISRNLSPRMSVNFQSGYSREDFENSAIEFSEWTAGFGMDWKLTRTVSVSLNWDRLTGQGDTALGPGTRDYIENRYSFSLGWSPER